MARAKTGASSVARGVGAMPRPLRVTSGSPSATRSLANALLTAEGVTWSRWAARATLCSESTVSRTRKRLRSMDEMLTNGEVTAHES